MHIAVAGISHRTAPLEVREQFSFSPERAEEAMGVLHQSLGLPEVVLLSTCNRTEAYSLVKSPDEPPRLARLLASMGGAHPNLDTNHFYTYHDTQAVLHLFRVASGLDSMVVGETQVLAQVKGAISLAGKAGTAGFWMQKLFQTALATGRRVHAETGLTELPVSVGGAAVDLARSIFGRLEGLTALLVGAGEMGEAVAERLAKSGATGIFVANRRFERAEVLAHRFSGKAVRFDDLDGCLAIADIVISSTSAPHHVITRDRLERAAGSRGARPIFLIDIASPRDIDPSVRTLDGVFLYDLDDLGRAVDETCQKQAPLIEKAQSIIEEQVGAFEAWRGALPAVPVIRGVRDHLEKLAERELQNWEGRLSGLDDEEMAAVKELVRSLVNRISHHPIATLKQYAREDGMARLKAVADIFGIEDPELDASADWRGYGI